MTDIEELIYQFSKLNYDQKKIKVHTMLHTIHDTTRQFWEICSLFDSIKNIPDSILDEIYESIMRYGNDVHNTQIHQKMWKTAYKLKKIQEREAQDRIQDIKDLEALEKLLNSIDI